MSIRFEIVDQVNLADAQFSLEHLCVNNPGQVRSLNTPFVNRPGHAEARSCNLVLILAFECERGGLKTRKVAAMLDLFHDGAQPPVSLLEVGKPRAGTADVTGEDHGQEVFLPL